MTEIWMSRFSEKLACLATLSSILFGNHQLELDFSIVPTWQLLSYMFPAWHLGISGFWSPAINLEPNQPIPAHPGATLQASICPEVLKCQRLSRCQPQSQLSCQHQNQLSYQPLLRSSG